MALVVVSMVKPYVKVWPRTRILQRDNNGALRRNLIRKQSVDDCHNRCLAARTFAVILYRSLDQKPVRRERFGRISSLEKKKMLGR